ncbi:MAG TPA: PLP-dependent aminotransferase family protein [Gaiellaceae bacterium]|nr:PLP-dependent aminotransferase family protein [Gaiellaceae bacterium]
MGVISFARGVPAPECLPVSELADCAREVLERDGETILNYGPVGGYGPLREWVAERHGVEPGRVLVTNGSLPGLNLVLGHFAALGRILVEAPTYDRPLKITARLGAEVRTIPQDDDGLDVDALEVELKRDPSPAFLYALPTFQNPSGRTLPLERRRRLVELAREHSLTVLEDDPYGRVRFDGESLPTLHELDGGESVLYSSSFSKIVAPGARVGYFVLTAEVAATLDSVAQNVYLTPALIGQATVYEFIRRGRLDPNIERVSELLQVRRDAMLETLDAELPSARPSRPEGGYFVWLDLPESVDAGELLAKAQEAGVTFVQGSDFFPAGSGGGRNAARLAFSFVSPDEIREGVSRLAGLLAPAVSVQV